jgi:hypothetical protein
MWGLIGHSLRRLLEKNAELQWWLVVVRHRKLKNCRLNLLDSCGIIGGTR